MGFSSIQNFLLLVTPLASAFPVWQPHSERDVAQNAAITNCTQPGMVALTYDDGPGPYTEELLDILEANDVKATFFVNGNNNNGPITEAKGAAAIKEVYANGHFIGSHTWSHADLATLSTEERRNEMDQLQDALGDLIGFTPTYMRPPYFSCPSDCLQDMVDFGYSVVNANLDTKDYRHDYEWSRNIYTTALATGSPETSSFITLVHDIHPETVRSLTQFMIDEAKLSGYRLVTLGECLGDAQGANWYVKANLATALGGNGGN